MRKVVLNRTDQVPSLDNRNDIAKLLKSRMDDLKFAYYDTKKGRVNYEGVRGSPAFEKYKEATLVLRQFDPAALSRRETKLAFWINIYNALVIHGIVEMDIQESVKEIPDFFEAVSYDIGGFVFSLDDIEHGILRGNKKKHLLSPKPFSDGDPRREFMMDQADPRIHFSLVCGSSSCPPVDVYSDAEIDEQLDLVSMGFVNSEEVIVDKTNRKLRISKIFNWYENDFGGREGVLSFIVKYRYDEEEKAFLKRNLGALHIDYNDYDWSLNIV